MLFANSKHIPKAVALLVLAAGIINIASAIWFFIPNRLLFLETLLPVEVSHFSRTLTLLIGFFLLYLAFGLWRRKYRAWLLGIGLIYVSLFLHLAKGLDIEESLTLIIPLGALTLFRHEFTVQSGRQEFLLGVRNALIILAGLFVYAVAGFYALNGQLNRPVNFNLIRQEYEYRVLGIGANALVAQTRRARWFEDSLSIVGFTAILLVTGSVFAPAVLRSRPTETDKKIARRLIISHSQNSTDYLALMDDKQYIFSPTKHSFIAYKINRGVAVTLGGPIGDNPQALSTLKLFITSICSRGLIPVFYNLTDSQEQLARKLGLKSLKIGQEAVVDTGHFSLEGSAAKDIRNAVNRLGRRGVIYQWYPLDQVSREVMAEVDRLHSRWVSAKKVLPLTFSVDFYPFPAESRAWLLTAYSPDKKLWGAFTFYPYSRHAGLALDMMLRHKQAPNGMVEAALAESIEFARRRQIAQISLGMAPLSDIKNLPPLFQNLNKIYRYQSLFEFKNKFMPRWQPKYLTFQSQTLLPAIGLALLAVHAKENLLSSFLKKMLR